jgi:hypothetical protein
MAVFQSTNQLQQIFSHTAMLAMGTCIPMNKLHAGRCLKLPADQRFPHARFDYGITPHTGGDILMNGSLAAYRFILSIDPGGYFFDLGRQPEPIGCPETS